jgi:hypothetical protein
MRKFNQTANYGRLGVDEGAVGAGVEGVAANGRYDAGRWGDYANAVAGKIGAVLFAGCVAGVEGEGKDAETGMYTETSTRAECQNIEHRNLNREEKTQRRRNGMWREGCDR